MIMLPTMSAGIRSGVNWMREYLRCRTRAECSQQSSLAEAWNAFEQDVAARQQADQNAIDHLLLADDDLSDFGANLIEPASRELKCGVAWHLFILAVEGQVGIGTGLAPQAEAPAPRWGRRFAFACQRDFLRVLCPVGCRAGTKRRDRCTAALAGQPVVVAKVCPEIAGPSASVARVQTEVVCVFMRECIGVGVLETQECPVERIAWKFSFARMRTAGASTRAVAIDVVTERIGDHEVDGFRLQEFVGNLGVALLPQVCILGYLDFESGSR